MRDKNLSFIQFSEQIEDFFSSRKIHSIKILREPVIDSPTLLEDSFVLRFPTNKLQDLRGIAVLSYFVPEFLGWKIRFSLGEKLWQLCPKDQLRLSSLLISKGTALVYLYETTEFSSHEIFGNLFDRGLFSLKNLQIRRRKSKYIRTKRRRGYNDKGTLRSPDRWLPRFDWSLNELQKEYERKTDLLCRVTLRLEKYLLQKYLEQQENLKPK